MKREEFFNALNGRLEMIEKKELEDILEEYRQHIDLKMQSGVSEEEAIKDFGDVNTLADEILESYHIRLDYDKGSKKIGKQSYFKIAKQQMGKFYVSFLGALSNACASVKGFFKSISAWLSNFKNKVETKAKNSQEINSDREENAGKKEEGRNKVKSLQAETKCIYKGTGRRISALIIDLKRFFLYLTRLFANIFIVCTGTFVGVFSAIALFCFGFLTIMLAEGYPVWGISIAALGGSLSLLSLTALIFSFMQTDKEKKKTAEREKNENSEHFIPQQQENVEEAKKDEN